MADPVQALRRLLAGSHHARPEDIPGLAMQAARLLDAREIVIYLVDYSQVSLVPMVGGADGRDVLAIDGTLPGRAFALSEVYETTGEDAYRSWVPLLDGTERLGVLEVVTACTPSPQLREDYQTTASLLAELLTSRRLYGDAVERTRRRLPMQLAAEIVWNLLPPLTFMTTDVTVSAILEPCYDVGGDAFDFAVNGDVLHVAVFDAVGHGIDASALTSLAISAYRNARRCGLDIVDTYRSMDKWIAAQHVGSFVTAVLAELDTENGVYRRISAGHPGELLLRDGKMIKQLDAPTALPLGFGHLGDPIPAVSEESLQPADQLLLYTDGVIEARTEDGEFFGVERLADFVTKALADRLPPPETMRRLVHAILGYQHERLQDDATAMLVAWRPAS